MTDFMEENSARNVSLGELAAVADLSPSYFSQAFKASTGLPPHRWQLIRRVEHAQRMLETTQATTLTEVAAATGFADQAHLTRVFRGVVGTTPAAWLRERRT
ncbi:AraC family transcriptional regulator [Breoghania sp. L-A4]|uniref:helix-turn-helix domain-containing protein n=1 Tax=Breoghania sp. L-A4 TaxID=2304600 RepID=UPI0020C15E5B|nr:AraC family transcriptional regulator [Breoghania sp. L-A4]